MYNYPMTVEAIDFVNAYQEIERVKAKRNRRVGIGVGIAAIGAVVAIGHPEIGGGIIGLGLGSQYWTLEFQEQLDTKNNNLRSLVIRAQVEANPPQDIKIVAQ